jgi:hypothetical protein
LTEAVLRPSAFPYSPRNLTWRGAPSCRKATSKGRARLFRRALTPSIILKWLQTTYGCEVVTFTADLGQGEELGRRAERRCCWASSRNIFVQDLREEFVRDYVFPDVPANYRCTRAIPARHLDRAAIDRQEADPRSPTRSRRRGLSRRDRQGNDQVQLPS